MVVTSEVFHIEGKVPVDKERLTILVRGLAREDGQFFKKMGDYPPGVVDPDQLIRYRMGTVLTGQDKFKILKGLEDLSHRAD